MTLIILKKKGYISEFGEVKTCRGNYIDLKLKGTINNCGAIKPRFSVQTSTYEKYEKRYLPAKDFGIIIVSTSQGIMTHKEAKTKKIGGKLLAYVY